MHEGLGFEVCRWLLSTGGVVRGGWGGDPSTGLYWSLMACSGLLMVANGLYRPNCTNQASEGCPQLALRFRVAGLKGTSVCAVLTASLPQHRT